MKHPILFTLLIILLTGLHSNLRGQQVPLSAFYAHNLFAANPAYAATYNHIHTYMTGKTYMVGMEGAPETLGLGISFPFQANPAQKSTYDNALLLRLDLDKRGVFNTYWADLGYAQHFRLTKKQDIFMGAGIGIINKNMVRSRIDMFTNVAPNFFQMDDPALASDYYSNTRLLASAGLTYRFSGLEMNAILPSMFQYSGFEQKLLGGLSYNFKIKRGEEKNYFRIIPSAYYHLNPKLPDMYDLGLKAIYHNRIWLQTQYKSNNSIMFAAGIKLNEYLPSAPFLKGYSLAYAYGMGMGELANLSKGTHEIMLSIDLDRNMLPDISFAGLKGGKKASRKDTADKELSKLQKENKELREKNKRLRKLLNKRQLDEAIQEEYIAKDETVYNYYYVILSAFHNERDAKDYQTILEANTRVDTRIIARKDRKYFFIYTDRYETKKEAIERINELNKTNVVDYIQGNIWIYGEK